MTPASYSKCLAFLFPEKYYIYDSRVALALEVISFVTDATNNITFQNATSKSDLTNRIAAMVKARDVLNESMESVNYPEYCNLIRMIANATGPDFNPQVVEQELFMLGGCIRDKLRRESASCLKLKPGSKAPAEFLEELKIQMKNFFQLP